MITLILPKTERVLTVPYEGEAVTVTIEQPTPQAITEYRVERFKVTPDGVVLEPIAPSVRLIEPCVTDISNIAYVIDGKDIHVNKDLKLTKTEKLTIELAFDIEYTDWRQLIPTDILVYIAGAYFAETSEEKDNLKNS